MTLEEAIRDLRDYRIDDDVASGVHQPSRALCERLAAQLNVSLEEFVSGKYRKAQLRQMLTDGALQP